MEEDSIIEELSLDVIDDSELLASEGMLLLLLLSPIELIEDSMEDISEEIADEALSHAVQPENASIEPSAQAMSAVLSSFISIYLQVIPIQRENDLQTVFALSHEIKETTVAAPLYFTGIMRSFGRLIRILTRYILEKFENHISVSARRSRAPQN